MYTIIELTNKEKEIKIMMKAYEGELNRTMEFNSEQDYNLGEMYNLGIHWATPDASSQEFLTGKKYTYNFHCQNGVGMAIDYDNMTDEEKYLSFRQIR